MNLLQATAAMLRSMAVAADPARASADFPGARAELAPNRLHELLFCDDAAAYAPRAGQPPTPWQALLYAAGPLPLAIRALAEDETQESRVRLLAFNWLRRHGHTVPPRCLLGVVLEVPLEGGLDVLSAYLDGSVRYLNHAAAPMFFEGPVAPLQPAVTRVLAAARPIVERIGPWDSARPPAPTRNVRLNFLVSDGLYFGEGPMAALQADAMAGPLLDAGAGLLAEVVRLASARRA